MIIVGQRERASNMQSGEFMKRTLVMMFVFLIVFSAIVLYINYSTGNEPDTLIMSVFTFCSVEGGVSAWIKVTKSKGDKKK